MKKNIIYQNKLILLIYLLSALCLLSTTTLAGSKISPMAEKQKVGIKITKIYNINPNNSSFKIIAWINIKHKHLTPNPMDQIEFADAIHQKKDFSTTTKTVNGEYISEAKFNVEISHHFNLKDFPLDSHDLIINIENSLNPKPKLVYTLYNQEKGATLLQPNSIEPGWIVKKTSVVVNANAYDNLLTPHQDDKTLYSRIQIILNIKRLGLRAFFSVFTTLYLSFFLFWLALALPITKNFEYKSVRNALSIASVVSLTTNLLITSDLLEHTFNFSIIDKLQSLTLIFCLVILIINSTHLTQACQDKSTIKKKNKARKIVAILSVTSYIIANILILSS